MDDQSTPASCRALATALDSDEVGATAIAAPAPTPTMERPAATAPAAIRRRRVRRLAVGGVVVVFIGNLRKGVARLLTLLRRVSTPRCAAGSGMHFPIDCGRPPA